MSSIKTYWHVAYQFQHRTRGPGFGDVTLELNQTGYEVHFPLGHVRRRIVEDGDMSSVVILSWQQISRQTFEDNVRGGRTQ